MIEPGHGLGLLDSTSPTHCSAPLLTSCFRSGPGSQHVPLTLLRFAPLCLQAGLVQGWQMPHPDASQLRP